MKTNSLHKLNFRSISLDTGLFRVIYLMLISFEMIAFLDIVSLVLKSVVLIWGLFILVHNFFIEKLAFKVKYNYLLWSFLTLMVITSVVHMSVWFIPNIAITYYTAVCFFIFYGMYTERSKDQLEEEMSFILKFFVYFGLIFGTLSILVLLFKREIHVGGYYLGIFRNRLIGVYTNSNILAFSMIEAIVACDIINDSYMRSKFNLKRIKKWILVLTVLVSFICLFLTDSNASFVFIIIYSTIRVFCNVFFKSSYAYGVKLVRSLLVTFGFCILAMSASFGLRDSCQKLISTVMIDIYKREDAFRRKFESRATLGDLIDQKGLSKEKDQTENKTEEPITNFHIGRQHYEVSSGRITLFKQGIEVFKHNPWIGIGRANLGLYSKKYLSGGLIHPDLHNGYLTILVSCGVIGFLFFGIFSFLVGLDVCKHLFLYVNKEYFSTFCKLFSLLVAYCGYCLFEKAILFDMTFMVGFFWSMLGYTVSYMYGQEKSPKRNR